MDHKHAAHLNEKMATEVEVECLLEGTAVRVRFSIQTGDISWQPSKIHKGSPFSLGLGIERNGTIAFPEQLLGFHFSASTILLKLFPKTPLGCSPCGRVRKQRDLLLDFRDVRDHGLLAEALDTWLAGSGRPRRLLVIVNPKAGKGKARETYLRQVLPLLESAGITVTMLETNYHKHAVEIAKGLNLNLYDGIACVSGDGIPAEVVNGFLDRSDWQRAIQIPIGHIISGSGNGLCKSALDHGGEKLVNVDNCTFTIIAGKRSALDVVTCTQASKAFHSILNVGWGIVSDIDVESEKYRWMGGTRLTVQTIVRTMSLRHYEGKMEYLPATECPGKEGVSGPEALAGVSAQAAAGPDGEFRGPAMEELVMVDGWKAIEGEFVLIWGQNVPWAATDMHPAPLAKLCDGCLDVCVVKNCSQMQVLPLFLEMQAGRHVNSPLVEYLKVRAMKLTPGKRTRGKVPGGILTLDGEVVARGVGAVGNRNDDIMDYDEGFSFAVTQGLLQIFIA